MTISGLYPTIAGMGLLAGGGGEPGASCWDFWTTGMFRSIARVVCFRFFEDFCTGGGRVSGFPCFLSAGFDNLAT